MSSWGWRWDVGTPELIQSTVVLSAVPRSSLWSSTVQVVPTERHHTAASTGVIGVAVLVKRPRNPDRHAPRATPESALAEWSGGMSVHLQECCGGRAAGPKP